MAKKDKKDDRNGSTVKGVALTLLVILALVGAYSVWQAVQGL